MRSARGEPAMLSKAVRQTMARSRRSMVETLDPALAARTRPRRARPSRARPARPCCTTPSDHLAVHLEADQVAPRPKPPHEVARAVDRVHDPAAAAAARVAGTLLAEEAVVGEGRAQLADDQPLALAVGHGDRRVVRLVLARHAPRGVLQRQLTRPAGDGPAHLDLAFPGHAQILALVREIVRGLRGHDPPDSPTLWTKRDPDPHVGVFIHACGSESRSCAVNDCAIEGSKGPFPGTADATKFDMAHPALGPRGHSSRLLPHFLEVNDEPSPSEASCSSPWPDSWCFPPLAAAQMTRGAISGTVRDASGAVVPGAERDRDERRHEHQPRAP